MANPEHEKLLKAGIAQWNEWRKQNPRLEPDLSEADLSGANLSYADLSKANLYKTNLTTANLSYANLSGAHMADATLSYADVRDTLGLVLDNCMVDGTRFSPLSRDPWSKLRRTYTGPRFFFNLLFLLLFFAPYVFRAGLWVGVANTQGAAISMAVECRASIKAVVPSESSVGRHLLKAIDALETTLRKMKDASFKKVKVWRLLSGADSSPVAFGATLCLLLYNVLRGFLTWLVSAMRDEEERSGISPRLNRDASTYRRGWRRLQILERMRPSLRAYDWLINVHRVALGMQFVAVCTLLYHAVYWLQLSVWVLR